LFTFLSKYQPRHRVQEEFEDIKGVIRIRKSVRMTEQHNDQLKKYKQRSTKHTHKTKDLT